MNLLYSAEDPRVARFAEDLVLFEKPATLDKWKGIVLDSRYSLVLGPSLHFMRFPEEGFSDEIAFRRWWQTSEYPLWNHLRELTEPD